MRSFSGGVGEAIVNGVFFDKLGIGFAVFTAPATYSGVTYVDNSGGTLILQGNGALLNTSAVEVRFGATLQIDNTAGNNNDGLGWQLLPGANRIV